MKILVTGSAGYIGSLLIARLLKEKTEKVVGVDLLPQPEYFAQQQNLTWIKRDLSQKGWEDIVLREGEFDALIHLAFKIRSPYGKIKETEKENLSASKNVFEFAFKNKIPRLIYSSSVAAYGAKKENIGKLIKESGLLMEDKSPYGAQKRLVEEMLNGLIRELNPVTHTVVIRLNSVTGPFGQGLKKKFGLITFLKKLLPFVIETHPAWARQFIHERDVEDLLLKLLESPKKPGALDIYNAAPPSFLTAKDIAKLLKKITLRVPQSAIRPMFWLAWHLTMGKMPTHPDSAEGLIYPINVDGSKIKEIGFNYQFGADDALLMRKVNR